MMKYGTLPLRMLMAALIILVSACGKEELVKPCGQDEPDTATTRSLSRGGDENTGDPAATSHNRGGGDNGGEGISDDGDDEADKERKRKGKR